MQHNDQQHDNRDGAQKKLRLLPTILHDCCQYCLRCKWWSSFSYVLNNDFSLNIQNQLMFCLFIEFLNVNFHFILAVIVLLPSVLWCCWLGGRKGIQPVKKLSGGVLAWLSVWSEVQTCILPCWCHCHSLSLASIKSRLVLPLWYRLTWVVREKGR